MIFLIGLGGSLGAISRYIVGQWISRRCNSVYPFGTWIINITGSFLLGAMVGLHLSHQLPDPVWLLIGVGFLGAFTTFSTFGYETLELMWKGCTVQAFGYVLSSVIVSLFAAWIGMSFI
jgi:CrcB protein